ncbi:retrovirus-related Pol polyprotein from transposon 297 [Trichonephila clavipes]|nr:retrovirus-related Pol polyprotein from transposon 297 [Trichonephila clavipes]
MLLMSIINFFSYVQLEGQTIETFVTQLKTLASTCEFAEQENGLIRDRIVLKIKDSGLQELLLRENSLNVPKYELKTLASTCEFAEQENGLIRDRIVLKIKDSGLQELLLRENSLNVPKYEPKLKSSLDRLEKEGIVSKVNKPTDLVQSLVIVDKPNGNLRLRLDPRDLNKTIKREHYQIPCTDDIISRLEGKKIFSVVDLKDGFWYVSLDKVSSEICTFNTPFGRYKFNKMPFGCEENSHDAIMSRFLERAKLLNIKFNPDKLQYWVSEVKYVGQIISKSGIKHDPDHIKAIVEMPTPKSKTEVRRLLGMMNFLSKFIPNVSKATAPLREIIHENVEFNWGKEQELSFVNIKELLAKAPILKVFSVNDEVVIQCDSSKDGKGSCLIQKGQPVSFVSHSLTNSEKNYAQIEEELLGIVFSFEEYHNFVYGRKFLYTVTISP